MSLCISVINNKKIIIFIFLLFFVAGFVLPQIVSAEGMTGAEFGENWHAAPAVDDSTQVSLTWYESIITGLGDAIAWGADYICQAAIFLYSEIFKTLMDLSVTRDVIFIKGWTAVKDIANMFIVLGFVFVGISTALRIRDYEAKKLLLPLIIVALLINFSGLICGLMIDASNIAMRSLSLNSPASGTMGATIKHSIDVVWDKTMTNAAVKENLLGYVANDIVFAIFYLVTAGTFLFLSIILFVRYIMLAILFILSPLAFVCYVFGFTKKYFTMWWEKFLKWILVGIGAIFFLWLASQMLVVPDCKQAPTACNMGQVELLLLKVLLFVVVGFVMALKGSGAAGIAVKGLATGVAGFAAGAIAGGAKGGLKMAADKTGVSRGATAAKDWTTQRLENMGLMKTGKTSANQQSRLNDKDRMTRINSMTAEQMVREIENPRFGNSAHYDRAAMMKKLGDNNQLGMIPAAQRPARIAEAVQFGVRPKDLIGGLASGDIANIVNNPAANPLYDEEARAKGTKTLMEKNDLHRIAEPQRARVVGEVARHGITVGDLAKSDYRYRGYDVGDNGRAAPIGSLNADGTVNTNAINQGPAVREQLETNWSSMSGNQRRNIDVAHLDRAFLMHKTVNADNLKDLRTADDAHRLAFADPLDANAINPALDADLAAAQAAALVAGNTNEQRRIAGVRAEVERILNP
jgi:hypothetical protein